LKADAGREMIYFLVGIDSFISVTADAKKEKKVNMADGAAEPK